MDSDVEVPRMAHLVSSLGCPSRMYLTGAYCGQSGTLSTRRKRRFLCSLLFEAVFLGRINLCGLKGIRVTAAIVHMAIAGVFSGGNDTGKFSSTKDGTC